ncbi:MAG: DMT family transporter, partial [Planctomycetota bacterium]
FRHDHLLKPTGRAAEQLHRAQPDVTCALTALSGVTFAGVVTCIRSLKDADPAFLITLNHGGTALVLSPWVLSNTESVSVGSYVALGMFGVFQMSIPYVLFARGLKTTSSPEASILTLIEPILVPLWVFLAWRNHPSYDAPQWWTLAGGLLILVGLVARYLPQLLGGKGETSDGAPDAEES